MSSSSMFSSSVCPSLPPSFFHVYILLSSPFSRAWLVNQDRMWSFQRRTLSSRTSTLRDDGGGEEGGSNGGVTLPTWPCITSRNVNKIQHEDGVTPLIYAAGRGLGDEVSRLIAMGADINWRDAMGNNALMEAASNGHTAIVQLLLDAGCDVDVANYTYGNTALLRAARKESGTEEVVALLVEYDADIGARNLKGR